MEKAEFLVKRKLDRTVAAHTDAAFMKVSSWKTIWIPYSRASVFQHRVSVFCPKAHTLDRPGVCQKHCFIPLQHLHSGIPTAH